MIETYMDWADSITRYEPKTKSFNNYDDPRYYNGFLYSTVIDRMVAEAKDRVQEKIEGAHLRHRRAIASGFTHASIRLHLRNCKT